MDATTPLFSPDISSIAILSDIHGNIRALDAILDDITGQKVDAVACNGDLITSSAHAEAVVKRIRSLGIPTTRGNHERYLVELSDPEHIKWKQDNWAPIQYDYHMLNAGDRQWLCDLPETMWLCNGSSPLVMTHAAPGNDTGRVTAQFSEQDWANIFTDLPHRSTLVGSHLHWFWQHRWQHYHFIRTPSAGLPLDGDTRAGYIILHRTEQGWQAEQRRLSYDLEGELATFRQSDYYHKGGVIAHLFWEELRTARWWIVPFFAHLRRESAFAATMPGYTSGYSHAEMTSALKTFNRTLTPEYHPGALSISS
ncbi:MAG: metallophosphoesterase [Chloroflexi bacterium]|nr:metallophosphoesterase [Chloroflexota bacterium]